MLRLHLKPMAQRRDSLARTPTTGIAVCYARATRSPRHRARLSIRAIRWWLACDPPVQGLPKKHITPKACGLALGPGVRLRKLSVASPCFAPQH